MTITLENEGAVYEGSYILCNVLDGEEQRTTALHNGLGEMHESHKGAAMVATHTEPPAEINATFTEEQAECIQR